MNIHQVLWLVASALALAAARPDEDIITEPRPGDEYVLVSSGQQTPLRNFETSHKIPEKHPQHRALRYEPTIHAKKTIKSGPKHNSEGIVAIEEDKRVIQKKGHKTKVSESIDIDIPVSKLEDIRIKESVKDVDTNPKMAVALEAMSESGKLSGGDGTTTQRPVLTTAAPAATYDYVPINFESIDDINSGLLSSNVKLETAASEQKQHSRIQIKKGPNGQDYEYEYIYYYYDEDEEGGKSKEKSSTAAPAVHNAHDGPQKAEADNHIAQERSKSKYSSIDRSAGSAGSAAASSEVSESAAAAGRTRQRGRNLAPAPVQEEIADDRLPSSTRFPPRGRTLTNTEAAAPAAAAAAPVEDAPAQSRSRARAHIRRPSSELVDLDSFKTHSGDASNQYKDPPSRYSSEGRSTSEAAPAAPAAPAATPAPAAKDTPREAHSLPSGVRIQEITDDSKLPSDYKTTTTYEHDTTEFTTMTAMEKVALDLYAYLAGESIDNEISPTSDDMMSFDGTTTVADEWTTETTTTEEPTTTTTTTTTPAPTTTTTTTTAAPTRPSRFKLRPGARGRTSPAATTTTTESTLEVSTKARGRFNRPRIGGRQSTTKAAAASEASTQAPETSSKAAPVAAKPLPGRRGLFAGRTRPSTTHAPPADDASAAASTSATAAPASHPRLHRPAQPKTSESPAPSSGSEATDETTTASSRTLGRGARPALRPLRPGPRLNLRPTPRLRGAPTPAPAAEPDAPETAASEAPATEPDNVEGAPSSTAAPEAARGVNKLRRRPLSPSPRPRVAVTAPPRRPNPLLKRKAASTEATTESRPAEETEPSVSEEKATETAPPPAETTPAAPLRGLEALYARRRAAAAAARPARRAHA